LPIHSSNRREGKSFQIQNVLASGCPVTEEHAREFLSLSSMHETKKPKNQKKKKSEWQNTRKSEI